MWGKPRHLFLIKQLAQQLPASAHTERTAGSPVLQREAPGCVCSESVSIEDACGQYLGSSDASGPLLWLIGFAG